VSSVSRLAALIEALAKYVDPLFAWIAEPAGFRTL